MAGFEVPRAADDAGQQLRREEEAVALVQAEREERPAQRLVVREHDLRVRRRLALRVHQGPRRNLLALVESDPDLSQCDDAGRHVEEERLVPRGAGYSDADGVGAEPGLAAAVGGDERGVAGHVHEVDRDEPRRHRHLGVGADAAQVVDVAQRRRHRAELARPLDQPLHHLHADPLAVSETPVEQHHRAAVPHHGKTGIRTHGLVRDVVDVVRDHSDAVAVVAPEVGIHQVVGNLGGLGGLAAGPFEQGADHAAQLDIGEVVHGGGHSMVPESSHIIMWVRGARERDSPDVRIPSLRRQYARCGRCLHVPPRALLLPDRP